jgi:hypothetical protein
MKQSEKLSEKLKPAEEPHDIETLFHAMKIASDGRKDTIFMDRLISSVRKNPVCNITDVSFSILNDLGLLKLPME